MRGAADAMGDLKPNTHLVACLCAAWCRTCGEYRATFDALAREAHSSVRFVWVDIEDDEEVLGNVDVVTFPTLLIAHGGNVVFFGAVMPQAQAARKLLQRALRGELSVSHDPRLAGLPARISCASSAAAKSNTKQRREQ